MSNDHYLARDGARIAYEITGAGTPLGYGHGVLLSRAAVRRMALFDIDAVAADRRLLTYDQRGHGHSTGRPVAADYTFDSVADDLLALVDAADLGEPLDFMGSSLGAAAALGAALRAPEKFRRLALLIPPVAWEGGDAPVRRWYLDTADAIDAEGAAAWRRGWANAEPIPLLAEHKGFDLTPDIDDELVSSALRGVGQSDLPDPARLATLPHPTLILTWDTDPLHPVETAERLHEAVPNSELHVSRSLADVLTWTGRVRDFFAG
ncbi:alpha/beta fold hydrolase [Actinophytocola xanthii]|uniref:Alpha/beta hydrolase n=1 Tax=Actinophytocola xanthii TaxID=1912961 RepID=A0A1Q8CRS4_9PSEU|nr:alpha/beta hydrolase [Actinophytocola xanthii]OLF17037.1 alpha/beta hydrolase [Actinophytocola xanthii]